jgi:hypothetical protein
VFAHLPGRLSLGVPPENVVAVIESINTPNISIPELGTEPTKGYLVGFVTPAGAYGIFCYLLFLDTNVPIIYISNPSEVAYEQYPILESDAIQFAESMGFMLDNMNFRAQPPEIQGRMVAELPFFRDQHPRRRGTQPAMAGVGGQTDAALVAKLLSSF